MAFINGELTVANFLNLASLAAMRKDQLMAAHWLNEAKKIDPSDNNYLQAKSFFSRTVMPARKTNRLNEIKRMKRFELSTLSLARRCSTTELHPH